MNSGGYLSTLMRLAGLFFLLILFSNDTRAQVCTVSAVSPAFGSYQASGSGNSANGSISVSCVVLGVIPQSVLYTVKLDLSAQAQGTQRRLNSGGSYLRYNVFCDAILGTIWVDGTLSTCIGTGGQAGFLGTLLTVFPVYANIPGGQFVASGTYIDSIGVQVLY